MSFPYRTAIALIVLLSCSSPREAAGQCQVSKLEADASFLALVLGRSIGIDGDLLVLGASASPPSGRGAGAAYVFEREGVRWIQVGELTASDGQREDSLGRSVAIGADVVVVGSQWADNGAGVRAGSAYVFERNQSGGWAEVAKLADPDTLEGSFLGWAAAVHHGTAVIGAPRDINDGLRTGSAYVFERDPNGVWTQRAKLLADDRAGGKFGAALAISGDVIVVGAREDGPFGFASGSAYVFERDPNRAWTQTAKLLPSEGHGLQVFGSDVAVSGAVVLVGAPNDVAAAPSGGAAYVFERSGTGGWTQTARLLSNDITTSDFFGTAVAIDDDIAVIGARGARGSGPESGSAYVFICAADGTWSQAARLQPDDLGRRDEFGRSVALSGNIAVVGAPFHDLLDAEGQTLDDAGAAYVFAVGPDADGDGIMDACLCAGDVDGDFVVGLSDLLAVLTHFGDAAVPDDPTCVAFWPTRCAGDLDRDADVDLTDLALVLANWENVCP